jgi:hypothetical protein
MNSRESTTAIIHSLGTIQRKAARGNIRHILFVWLLRDRELLLLARFEDRTLGHSAYIMLAKQNAPFSLVLL